jgi:hypothetical protein
MGHMMTEAAGGKDVRRGLRRYHRFRMRRHAARLMLLTWFAPGTRMAWIRRLARFRGDNFTRHRDTASYDGNPRRSGRVTRQELRARHRFEEQRRELDSPTEE